MDEEHPTHRIGEARQRAQEEIADPADRLQDPERTVLVVEKGPVESHPTGDRFGRRVDLECVVHAPWRGRSSVEGRAVRGHARDIEARRAHCERKTNNERI